jgi:hypothetical protein
LLAVPLTVTTTLPVVAPEGTTAVIDVGLQLVIEVAGVPPKVTVLLPCDEPKLVPVIVTAEPTAPEVGFRLLMVGDELLTVHETPLLAVPLTVTITLPVVAPVGTCAVIDAALQLVIVVAAVPLKVTVLAPCVVPKFAPVIVTESPTLPNVVFRLVMEGDGTVTVNETPALARPLTVTTTLPVAAPVGTTATIAVGLQLVIEAAGVPLKVTVLVPCVVPKFEPMMATEDPTRPEFGVS